VKPGSRRSGYGCESCRLRGISSGTLERTGWLTPYTAETIAEDAVRAAAGATLELTVAESASEGLVRAERQFGLTDRLLDRMTGAGRTRHGDRYPVTTRGKQRTSSPAWARR